MAEFTDSVRANIKLNEGGFVDDSHDRGGATNHGITQDTLNAYCDSAAVAHFDVKDLNWDTAYRIYKVFFWDKYRAFAINDQRLAENYFDCLINSGPHWAGLLLQEAAKLPGDHDGIVGSGTVTWVNSVDAGEANVELVRLRSDRYRAIVDADASQDRFLEGWMARAQRFVAT